MKKQPLHEVRWVKASELNANDYNPNKVFPPELELLKISIMEDGWTQPVVINEENTIIDGFHRWTLVSTDKEIAALTGGLVPVVTIKDIPEDRRMLATVRHNRARGQHGVLRMGDIVRKLRDSGMEDVDICLRLGMELEELDRLAEIRSAPDIVGKDSFGLGWVPAGKPTNGA